LSLSQPAHANRTDLERPPVKIALLGCGTVGAGVAQLLLQQADAIAAKAGRSFALAGIAVRSADKPRPTFVPPWLFTTAASALVDDPDVGLVIECIGGLSTAGELVERALSRGKHVVTANKDLLATYGPALRSLAAARGVGIAYEAAVGGAIPIVRTLTGALAGERIIEVGGVLNGTTNFILDAMSKGAAYADALGQAQRDGYAEADPSSDTSGLDAAHKLAILSQLAFARAVTTGDVPRVGIESVTRDDVSLARRLGLTLKLIAVARDGEATVAPTYVPREHPFGTPAGVHNCIRVVGATAGTLTFAGAGAGREPTASAVIADVIATLAAIGRGAGAGDGEQLRPGAALKPLPLRRLVRVSSFRDARPALDALAHAGIAGDLVDGAPAVLTRSPADTQGIGAALAARDIVPESAFGLWEDVPARPLPQAFSLGSDISLPATERNT
jgi:homoserine dehydrogenase